jgi:predicted ATPase
MVTLMGTGGVGKTRLALRVAAAALATYADGAWLVELAALQAPQLVPATVASALGIRQRPGHPLLETLVTVLHPRRLLVSRLGVTRAPARSRQRRND